MACSASNTDSSRVSGCWILASAIRKGVTASQCYITHRLPDENHRLFDSFTRFVIQREMEESLKARKLTISQTQAKIANQHLEPSVMSKILFSTASGIPTPQSYKSPKKFKMRLKLSRQLAIDQNR